MTKPDLIDMCEQIFPFGSRVYGTFREDSDFDFIAVLKQGVSKTQSTINFQEYHYQIYTYDEFVFKIKSHDIQALECIFLSKDKLKKPYGENFQNKFELNLNKLRESISTITNNSWVKCKKKLIISDDYDKLSAIKSCFHSLRILNLGIQIARQEYFLRYDEMNYVYFELMKLSQQFESDILWEKINSKYKTQFNKLSSEFKTLAPKDLKIRDKNRELKTILESYEVYSPELLKELFEVFEN